MSLIKTVEADLHKIIENLEAEFKKLVNVTHHDAVSGMVDKAKTDVTATVSAAAGDVSQVANGSAAPVDPVAGTQENGTDAPAADVNDKGGEQADPAAGASA
jgi:hypothetical protein